MKNVFLFLALTILTSCEPDGYQDLVNGHNGLTTLANKNYDMINLINEQNKTFVAKFLENDKSMIDLNKGFVSNARKTASNTSKLEELELAVDSLKKENIILVQYNKLYSAKLTELSNKVQALESKVK